MSVDRDRPRLLGGLAIVAKQSFVAAPEAMHQDLAGGYTLNRVVSNRQYTKLPHIFAS
jgi:hypothetical protein